VPAARPAGAATGGKSRRTAGWRLEFD
jgi:hypothetical protein